MRKMCVLESRENSVVETRVGFRLLTELRYVINIGAVNQVDFYVSNSMMLLIQGFDILSLSLSLSLSLFTIPILFYVMLII